MAVLSLGALPNTPLYTGGTLSPLVPALLPVAINGHPYLADWKQYNRHTIDALRTAQDTEALPSEASLSVEGFWPRFQADWSLGAGQIHYDDHDSPFHDRRRFYRSAGVDPWTPKQLSLLPDTRKILAGANVTKVITAGAYLYVIDGTSVKFTNGQAGASPSWTTVTGPTGTLYDLTTDGAKVYLAASSGVWSSAIAAAAMTIFSTGVPATNARQVIAVVAGRLLAGASNILEELSASGVQTILYTHVSTSFVFTAIAASQRAIYAAGSINSEVGTFIRFTVVAGALTLGGSAADLPNGEVVTSLLGYVGVMMIGTSKGVRLANVDSDGSLTYGRVIETGPARDMTAEADFVWFGWDAIGGLGRLRLSEFADPDTQVPAYASDIVVNDSSDINACLSVTRSSAQTYFVVSGEGLYASYASLVTEGYVETGWIDYGAPFVKTLIDLDMRHAALTGTIEVSIFNAGGVETSYGSSNEAGSGQPAEAIPFQHARHERFRLRLTLTEVTDVGPTLYSWYMRVSPSPPRTEEIILPVYFSENLDVGYGTGQPYMQNLFDELGHLRLLCEDGQVVSYQEGNQSERVQITNWELRGYKDRGDGINNTFAVEGMMFLTMHTI